MDSASFCATGNFRSKNLDEYVNIEELGADVDTITHENFVLSQTAEVIERYLRKRSPATLLGMDKFIECATLSTRSSLVTGGSFSIVSAKSLVTSPRDTVVRASTTSSVTRGMVSRSNAHSITSYRICSSVKADMVERELEESRMTMDRLKRKFKSAKFLLQTEEENLRINVDYLEKGKIALEDFLAQNTDTKSGKVHYDKFVRFLEREVRTDDRNSKKIKLETISLNSEYRRLCSQQQQRLELKERLHPIDIEKLLIENEEQLNVLDQKNKELQELKKVIGKKGQNLVSVKSKLNDTMHSIKNLAHDLEYKKTKCAQMGEDEIQYEHRLRRAEVVNQDIKELNANFKSHDVHSYLQIQRKLEELKLEKENWERRCMYQSQQISLLEHQIKQLFSGPQRRSSLRILQQG